MLQYVNRPSSSTWAAAERGSIGAADIRWLQNVSETTTSQPSKRLSSSSSRSGSGKFATFVPTSGKSSASPASDSSAESTTGSGS